MGLIEIATGLESAEDRIEMMWKTMRLLRAVADTPDIWKLSWAFVDALADFMNLPIPDVDARRNTITSSHFLDVGIDYTSGIPCLIGQQRHYYINLRTASD